MTENLKEALGIETKPKIWRLVFKFFSYFLFTVVVLFGLSSGLAAWYLKKYQNRIYPGVYAGHYHLGNMTRDDLNSFIENLNNRLAKEGVNLDVDVDGKKSLIKINTVSTGEKATDLLRLDSYVLWQDAFAVGRDGNDMKKLFFPLYLRVAESELLVPIKTDWINLVDILKDSLPPLANAPRDAYVKINSFNPVNYETVKESAGMVFDIPQIISDIQNNLSQLYFVNTKVAAEHFEPTIKYDDAALAAQNIGAVLSFGPIGLNFIDPQTNIRRDWSIDAAQFSKWLVVEKDDSVRPIFSLDKDAVKTYLESIRPLVDRLPKDAKFSFDNGKVKEFQASQTGLNFDTEKTSNDLIVAFKERNYRPVQITKTVSLSVNLVDPTVKMADVNSLGIEDIIGVGYSTFKDSHSNRIKNIAHAVERLNGVLIKPDEEFSAIKYAGPFTAENGFLPEAIIKGNEIKNEIGGGMCQIGTTLFRMAMNSGMDITQRQNHSLVVGYYSDPVNGNPGTDAALYEPYLDLKFKNDTGSYLLLQTDIDFKKQQLTFTLWGKPDGRKGWYTHPEVKKWIPYGETQNIQTDTLKAGEVKCQAPFRGAVASFTYTRVTPDGQKLDRVFDSYYRPLPQICMVGASSSTSSTPETVEVE